MSQAGMFSHSCILQRYGVETKMPRVNILSNKLRAPFASRRNTRAGKYAGIMRAVVSCRLYEKNYKIWAFGIIRTYSYLFSPYKHFLTLYKTQFQTYMEYHSHIAKY